ncbi:fungal fucose-specific lectin protein [Neofusicoccum parvum]|uniref:Fungal fucose-specific lectin protein n=1 Tax=Neofusicoccum parvum TaxID=310453 RepID=A0ACB5S4D2_9PEZI|nr:fungal fucose-specific lectin protein [Neofusicoccum parvum]
MPNLTLYFLDSSSRLRQLQTSNPDDTAWALGSFDSAFNVPDASHLASYSCQNPSDPDHADAWFQDADGYYQIIDSSGAKIQVDNTISTSKDVNLVKPPQNSSLTLVSHYIYDYNTSAKGSPYVSLFYVNSDILYEYHYNNSKFDFIKHFDNKNNPRLPPSANLAGFSWGYNDTLGSVNGVQILYTDPDNDSGGISLLRLNKYIDTGEWYSTDASAAGNPFQGVARYSSVAATQSGRVYAVVEDEGKVELREWEYLQDEDTYGLVGTVNTEVV